MDALIIADRRETAHLASVLSSRFTVYGKLKLDGANSWTRHSFAKDWSEESTDPANEISDFDVLFVHAGDLRQPHILEKFAYKRLFVFSTGQLESNPIPSFPDAIPILRPFSNEECPVKPEHMAELVDFVSDIDNVVKPPFCSPYPDSSPFHCLAMVCQAYALECWRAGIEPCSDFFQVFHLPEPKGKSNELAALETSRADWWCELLKGKGSKVSFSEDLLKQLDHHGAPHIRNFLARLQLDAQVEPTDVMKVYASIAEALKGQ